MLLLRNLFFIINLLLIQSCVQVLPDAAEPKPKFDLDLSFKKSNKSKILKTIIVEEPYANSILNSKKIVVEKRFNPPRMTFAKDQEWEERLPEILEQGLVVAIEKTGGIKGVAKYNQGVIPDYIIVSDLNEYKIVYQEGKTNPLVEISWKVKILKLPERKIIAVKDINVLEEVPYNTFSSILRMFNLQTSKIMHDISLWVRHHIDNEN